MMRSRSLRARRNYVVDWGERTTEGDKRTRYSWSIPAFFHKGDNFCDFMFAFLYTYPIYKPVLIRIKEFTLSGSKFIRFS